MLGQGYGLVMTESTPHATDSADSATPHPPKQQHPAASVTRAVLAAGSTVFAVTAPLLLLAPGLFADWLGLEGDLSQVRWSLQMVGACLIALSGQMWLVRRADAHTVMSAAVVMLIGGGVMTLLTTLLPGGWTAMRWGYFAFGASFMLAYAVLLLWSQRSATDSDES